jgi:hypothetical protein
MEFYLKNWIENTIDRSKWDWLFKILERWIGFWDGFKDGFLNVANVKFPILRFNLGSTFAIVAATYNLYNIRNLILRYTLAIFKTKNPLYLKLVK